VQHVYRLRAHRDLGVRPGDRFASLGIVRGPAPGDTKLVGRLLRGTRLYRRTRLDGFREPAVILDELHGLRPQVISGYPGVLADLADANAAGRRRPLAPRLLLSGAEVLAPHLRRRIETGFKAPVRDIYGCHEINVVAWECPIGGMLHTCDDAAIVEILKDGRPAAPGEEGEVVLTALHAFAMPFIRYRLGDLAVRGPEDCACGRPFASIGTVAGRVFEMFRLPGGKRVHAHRVGLEVVRAGPWIRQYQLVQERADRVVLHAVAGAPPDVPAVEHAVRAVLGDGVEFVVTLAERIDADPSGKVRTYRTMVP
jgi:phenylacetate-CoA ligase